HPWERGTNENTNGLLRQYFPKGTDFNTISDKEIRDVATQLNNRPRKILNYKTPQEIFWADFNCQIKLHLI
ncbi:MAG: IS30 family transposase, partial [Fusobacteria bacterium]|nr:IS30 family transposase [Fusobacteriota bacterium]